MTAAGGGRESDGMAGQIRMRRLSALGTLYSRFEEDDIVVVTIMGAVAAELQSLGHRASFFYLQHAMGLASSVGLGIALSRPELTVVVLDGDGSVLMNLGGLTTLGRYRPPNLVHVVFDNESLLSVGGFPTATRAGADLVGIAAAAGVPRAVHADSPEDLLAAFDAAVDSGELTTIVAKVDDHYEPPGGTAGFVTSLGLLENRFRFARHLASLRPHLEP
jgi:sulfopyruvate decarboxylase subunit beta